MSTPGPMLTPGDLRSRLGMSERAFYEHQKAGDFERFELKNPIGRWRYSTVLVDKFLSGESVVKFGRGSRKARKPQQVGA